MKKSSSVLPFSILVGHEPPEVYTNVCCPCVVNGGRSNKFAAENRENEEIVGNSVCSITRGHSATCGHLAVESVGISVWWSDFSILQAFCTRKLKPDNSDFSLNLLAKYLEQFRENNFTRHLQFIYRYCKK